MARLFHTLVELWLLVVVAVSLFNVGPYFIVGKGVEKGLSGSDKDGCQNPYMPHQCHCQNPLIKSLPPPPPSLLLLPSPSPLLPPPPPSPRLTLITWAFLYIRTVDLYHNPSYLPSNIFFLCLQDVLTRNVCQNLSKQYIMYAQNESLTSLLFQQIRLYLDEMYLKVSSLLGTLHYLWLGCQILEWNLGEIFFVSIILLNLLLPPPSS